MKVRAAFLKGLAGIVRGLAAQCHAYAGCFRTTLLAALIRTPAFDGLAVCLSISKRRGHRGMKGGTRVSPTLSCAKVVRHFSIPNGDRRFIELQAYVKTRLAA